MKNGILPARWLIISMFLAGSLFGSINMAWSADPPPPPLLPPHLNGGPPPPKGPPPNRQINVPGSPQRPFGFSGIPGGPQFFGPPPPPGGPNVLPPGLGGNPAIGGPGLIPVNPGLHPPPALIPPPPNVAAPPPPIQTVAGGNLPGGMQPPQPGVNIPNISLSPAQVLLPAGGLPNIIMPTLPAGNASTINADAIVAPAPNLNILMFPGQ